MTTLRLQFLPFDHSAILALVLGVLVFMPDAFAQYKLTPLQKRLVSGSVSIELDLQAERQANLLTPIANIPNFFSGLSMSAPLPGNYFPAAGDECGETLGTNVKVNQNCLNITDPMFQGRAQALDETAIAQDPKHPQHLVAASNDYRFGDAYCHTFYSLDGSQHWHDSTPPTGFTRGASFGGVVRQYWQASSDPSVAWDTKGNAYLACILFQRGDFGLTSNPDLSSAVYVFRSTLNSGASWNFPGRPVAEFNDLAATGCCLEDKSYLTVDNQVGSPFQDRVYVTWQFLAADGTVKVYESYSKDYGESFSPPVLVSTSSTLCPVSIVVSGNCDISFFPQPFTGPDGALYVIFKNANNAVAGMPTCGGVPCDNHNQILLAKSSDGGVSFGPLVKVADYYDAPDCATYQGGQDFPQGCFPEKGASMNSIFRSANYAVGAVHPKHPGTVIVTVGSYINVHSNEANGCVPAGFSTTSGGNLYTGVKTAGACNNDILLSVSNDGGATFTGGTADPRSLQSVNQAKGRIPRTSSGSGQPSRGPESW